jgi:GNAT superfamily N-acetyltransferase
VSSSLTVRYANSDSEEAMREDTRATARLLVGSHLEAGIPERLAPLNHAKALQSIYEAIRDGLVLMAFDGEELVGVLGALQYDFWYSDKTLLAERFFYIKPEYRDGQVLRAILREARDVATDLGIVIHLTIANTHKNRPPRNGLERVGDVLSYLPRGSAYQIAPAEGESA